MGVLGLLPLLHDATRTVTLEEFRGKTAAVDAYCWLHRGAMSCASLLVQGRHTDAYLAFCMRFVNLLKIYDIKPIIVFDGKPLPAKMETNEKRAKERNREKQLGIEALKLGKQADAQKHFSRAVTITNAMVMAFINELRKQNVDYIVAPYEADAQLAFLITHGFADFVVSEDSDLIVFGCHTVFYKLDIHGVGRIVEAKNLYKCMKMKEEDFVFSKFRHMCILSGCDYIKSLRGIGLKKAMVFITMTHETDPAKFLSKLPSYLKKRTLVVSEEYIENFLKADATFQYQLVYNPAQRKLQTLHDVKCDAKYLKNIGDFFELDVAFELAIGNYDPKTMVRVSSWEIPKNIRPDSIWSPAFALSEKLGAMCNLNKNEDIEMMETEPPEPTTSKAAEAKLKENDLNLLNQPSTSRAADEADAKFEDELKMYKNLNNGENLDNGNGEPQNEVKPERLSPVLNSQPIIRTKVSRFRLGIDKNKNHYCRFFRSYSDTSSCSNGSFVEVELNANALCSDVDIIVENDDTLMCPPSKQEESESVSPDPVSKKKKIVVANEPEIVAPAAPKMKQQSIRDMFKNLKK